MIVISCHKIIIVIKKVLLNSIHICIFLSLEFKYLFGIIKNSQWNESYKVVCYELEVASHGSHLKIIWIQKNSDVNIQYPIFFSQKNVIFIYHPIFIRKIYKKKISKYFWSINYFTLYKRKLK